MKSEKPMATCLLPERSTLPPRTRLVPIIVTVMLCVYWAALFYGTHTKIPAGMLPGNTDKLIHFGAYAGLGILLMTLRASRGAYSWYSVAARWCVLACYGAFDELTQLLVNRNADMEDWLADVFGAAIGLGLVTLVVGFQRLRKPKCSSAVLDGKS